MIKRIIIDNFMAHEHTELELGPGVTILTGNNNTGKSAIVEALRCVATNPSPRYYIRHGAKEARVTVELEDGTRVVWVRKKRSPGYELWAPGAEEPVEYWKFGRKPPEDVRKALRLDMVELETGGEIDIHVGNQREPVFLLNQPGSAAAAFFAASTESAHLLAMQNVLKRRTRDAKRRAQDLRARRERVCGELDRLAPLPGLNLAMDEVQALEDRAALLETAIPALETLIERRGRLDQSLARTQEQARVLGRTNPLPSVEDVRSLDHLVGEMKISQQHRARARETTRVLTPLVEVPEAWDTGALAGLLTHLGEVGTSLARAAARAEKLQNLPPVPTPGDCGSLSSLTDELLAAQYRHRRYRRWSDVMKNLVEPPVLAPLDGLARVLRNISDLEVKIASGQSALQEVEADLKGVVETMDQRIKELGCCPVCGGELTTRAFIDRGCSHES